MKTTNKNSQLQGTAQAIAPATQTTRRRFMSSAVSVTAIAALPALADTASSAPNGLVASTFRGELNSTFTLTPLSPSSQGVAVPLAVKLIDVTSVRHSHAGHSAEYIAENVFALKFGADSRAPNAALKQDTYWLSHPRLGQFAVMLVPTPSGRGLRAEFNRT